MSAVIFVSVVYAETVIFYQTNIDDPAAWSVLNSSAGSTGIITGTLVLTSSQNITANNITLQSDTGAWRTLISGGSHRFFNVAGGNTLTLDNIILTRGAYDGLSTEGGGAIYVGGTGLTLNGNFSIEASSASTYGGAVYVASGTATFGGSASFIRNYVVDALGHGGAIYSGGDIVFSSGSYLNLQSNSSGWDGGGIYTGSGTVSIGGQANISSNTARTGNGGGIYASSGVYFYDKNAVIIISSNVTQYLGGGIYSGKDIVFDGGAEIKQNIAMVGGSTSTEHRGGGLYAASTVEFTNQDMTINLRQNSAIYSGGAIYAVSDVTFSGSAVITLNKVETSSGGAIYSGGSINFDNSSGTASISLNASTDGSGGALFSQNDIIFSGYVNAVYNSAGNGDGGAFYSKTLTISDGAEITYNKAAREGGAVYIHDGTSDFYALSKDVLFSNNISSGVRNDVNLGGNAVLNLTVSTSASMTFDGGITYSSATAGNIVNKDGAGNLYLNGDFIFQTLNITSGTAVLGSGSSFNAVNFTIQNTSASTETLTVIDMRNGDINDNIVVSGVLTSTTNGKIYLDIDSDTGFSDKISASTASLNGTWIKAGIAGIEAAEQTYNIINSTSGYGALRIDNTNAEGSTMTRVQSYLTYSDGVNVSSSIVPPAWKSVDIVLSIDQLNAIEGLTDNQKQTALALDEVYGFALGDLFKIIDSIDVLDIADRKKALNSLSGHIYANAITLPALNISKDSVMSRLRRSYFIDDDSSIKRNIWAQGYLANNKYKGDKNSPGDFDASNSGLQAGFDTMKNDMQIFGLSIGNVNTSAKQNSDTVDITGFSIGGYGAIFFENNLELKLMLMGGRQNYTSLRKIEYGEIQRETRGDFNGYSVNTSAEMGYDYFYKGNIYFRPFLGLDYSYVTTQEFTERGFTEDGAASSADLTIYGGSYHRVNTNIGFQVNNGTEMRAKWYAQAQFNFLAAGRYGEFEGKFENTDKPLSIAGIENDLFSTALGFGVLYDISASWSVYSNVNGLFAGSQTGFYGNIGINYKFTTTYVDFYER